MGLVMATSFLSSMSSFRLHMRPQQRKTMLSEVILLIWVSLRHARSESSTVLPQVKGVSVGLEGSVREHKFLASPLHQNEPR